MDKIIKDRIDAIRQGRIPEGYNHIRYMVYPKDWGEPCALNSVLTENKERNEALSYGKDDVLSVSGDCGIVNQIDLLGRSYAGESVAHYHIVHTGDIVYTKSPLKQNPHGIIKLNKGKPGIVSTLYAVYHCSNNITGQYIDNYFCIDSYLNNYLKPIVKRGAKNDMKVNNQDVLTGVMPLPPLSEQKKISEILDHFDKLINLCEAKVNEYKRLKKTCLCKMFPQNGSNVPELRFPGFTGAWEQRKFGKVFDYLQNNSLTRAELRDEGIVMNVHYGDILIKYGEVLDVRKDRLTYLIDESLAKKYQSSLLKNGDVIIADAAEDETVGKCSEIAGLSGQTVLSGLHTIPCRPTMKFAEGYLGYYMNSGAYHDQLLPLIQGTKISSISKSAIQDTEIAYPKSENEQALIGKYFENLDDLITLHQREADEYTRLKKAMTQLLLTGIVRV